MVVTVEHGGTSIMQHVGVSHVPVAQTVVSTFLFQPRGQVRASQVSTGVVVTVVTLLQHKCELHSGPSALPHKMRSVFMKELAGQAKLAQVL